MATFELLADGLYADGHRGHTPYVAELRAGTLSLQRQVQPQLAEWTYGPHDQAGDVVEDTDTFISCLNEIYSVAANGTGVLTIKLVAGAQSVIFIPRERWPRLELIKGHHAQR